MITPAAPGQAGLAWQPTELVSTLLSKSARDVVRLWISNSEYLDDNHQPRSLCFTGSECCDFSGLVRQVNGHLAPAIIRNELLRKGIVEQHDNGSLLLRRSAYVQDAYVPCADFADNKTLSGDESLVPGKVFRRRRNDIL